LGLDPNEDYDYSIYPENSLLYKLCVKIDGISAECDLTGIEADLVILCNKIGVDPGENLV
jgi:hypothetical protein